MAGLNCKISGGVGVGVCDTSVAGVSELLIMNWVPDVETAVTSGCVVSFSGFGTEKAYDFVIADNSGYATATGSIGGSQNKYFMHTVGGTITNIDCDLLEPEFYKNLFLSKVILFVRTNNGDALVFGLKNGLTASTFEFTTGTNPEDAAGITFVFDGPQPEGPLKVDSWSTVLDLKGA